MTTAPLTGGRPGPSTAELARSIRRGKPRYGERAVETVLALAAFLSVLTTIGIVLSLFNGTWDFFQQVRVREFLFGTVWTPLFADPSYGVLPIVGATLLVTGIAILVAMPLGLGAALYLSEYASPRARKVLKPVLEVLAGIPTVVFGFFALSFVTPNVLRLFFDGIGVFNALSAGLVIGILIIPIIASLSEDALSSVPQSMRDGALALGATRTNVARKVVLPAALSGVIASFVLGLSRAIGETMVVVIAAGSLAQLSIDPTQPMQTMTAFIAQAAAGDRPAGSVGYNALFAVGALLFVITLVVNVISIRLVRRYREVYE
ncbi:MAG TPA: phosphate ABC transporter permease subunit PstC [Mycobacteriales bacterium]|nr:phosphate ABC transporter permease subunit PstC [Mycobacteriales bacterium]